MTTRTCGQIDANNFGFIRPGSSEATIYNQPNGVGSLSSEIVGGTQCDSFIYQTTSDTFAVTFFGNCIGIVANQIYLNGFSSANHQYTYQPTYVNTKWEFQNSSVTFGSSTVATVLIDSTAGGAPTTGEEGFYDPLGMISEWFSLSANIHEWFDDALIGYRTPAVVGGIYLGASSRSTRYKGARTDVNLYKGQRGLGWV